LLVSQDESVVYSGGTDGVVCIWDINQRQVVQTFGQEKYLRSKESKYDDFHSDSIWQIQQSADNQSQIMTAGKDGRVFLTDVAKGTH
jgi:WD40 repeat protein